MSSNKDIAFEEAIAKLESIVSSLEKGDVPLDRSLELFEEGVSLIKICNEKLDVATKKVKMLTGDPEEDFKSDEN